MPILSLIVPTYNERPNVGPLFQRLAAALDDFEVIFVDDGSPDGTAQAIRELQEGQGRIRLLERPGKMGLASAVWDGLALARGEWVGMMDADLSHQPEDLSRMLARRGQADIVIGSRYMAGARILGWPLARHILSRGALLIARLLFRLPARDVTSGFVLYRRELLKGLGGRLEAQGYKLLLEVLVRARGARVQEVPITFVNRARGRSKLNLGEVWAFLQLCWKLKKGQQAAAQPGPP